MTIPEPSSATLADLIEAVQRAGLTDVQKRDRVSAIRTAARALGAEPSNLPINIKLLRRRLEKISPTALGMTQTRWNNVRSLVNRSLELKTEVTSSAQKTPVLPAWKALAENLPRSGRLRLGALLRFLSTRGVGPDRVTLEDLEGFRTVIVDNRLRATPEKTWDGVLWTWNKCVQELAGWPAVIIPREDRRTVYVLPWSDFPASLQADVQDYLKVLSGDVINEDGPLHALRSSTLENRAYQARAAASALVVAGTPAESIRSLADIARLEPAKLILGEILNRGEGDHRAGAFNMANFLKSAAQHWVKVDEAELAKIRRITTKLSPKSKGLTDKNRRRLMPLNDPDQVRRFLDLPSDIAGELKARPRRSVVDAVSAQLAVAIGILQAVPLRMRNLAALDLVEHIVERGRRVFILIPSEEVKNAMPYEMELPKDVADLIAWYCISYRDLLADAPTTALFPGEGGGPKSTATLSGQISRRVEQRLGWPVNAHLFRHIAAKLYLDRRPGEYGLVSRLLNHKSVATTMRAYTGAESAGASRHYQSVIAGLRAQDATSHKPQRRAAR